MQSLDIYPIESEIDYKSLLETAKQMTVNLIENRHNKVVVKSCEVKSYNECWEVLEFTMSLTVNEIEKFITVEASFEDGKLNPEDISFNIEFEDFSA